MRWLLYFLSPTVWLARLGLRSAGRPVGRAAAPRAAIRPAAAQGAARGPADEFPLAGIPARQPRRVKWIRATAVFYLASAACHVACVVLLLSFPLSLRLPSVDVEPRIDAEEKEEAAPPPASRFNLAHRGRLKSANGDSSDQAAEPAPASADNPDAAGEETYRPSESEPAGGDSMAFDIDTAGATKAAQLAIQAGLDWFVRHQESDGHWSLTGFAAHCQGPKCDEAPDVRADAAATGLALLPLLGAGHTQAQSGPYRESVDRALRWLIEQQHANGDLSGGAEGRMYPHAIATLALTEDFALTRDRQVGAAAQLAVNFIVHAQNKATGGWHYEPGGLGNTSIVAWQIMALASAQRGGLQVDPVCWNLADKWLRSVAAGEQGGLFCYEPGRPVTSTMTAIGLLARQLEGANLQSPAQVEGRDYLLAHLPISPFSQDVFYWYFSSPVMRNFGSANWQVWFHALRRTLMETQTKTGCAAGSWGLKPAPPEAWSARGGRIMVTSFAVQLLELEYGQLPLHAPLAAEPVWAAAKAPPARRE